MSFVRVALPNGREVSVSATYVKGIDGLTPLDKPATNGQGRVLPESRSDGRPIKRRTTVDKAVAKKTAAKKTASSPAATPSGDAADLPEEASK